MTAPLPPDTTARLAALVDAAGASAEAAVRRADRADALAAAVRGARLTGWDSVRRTIGRALGAVRREAERAEVAALEAFCALEALRGGTTSPAAAAVPIATGARRAAVALAGATGSLGRAGRLVAGLAACLGTHPGAPRLWSEAWPVLLTVDVGEVPTGRRRTPRTPADAEVELAGVVAHLAAMAPAFAMLEVVGGRGRYVQAYADEHVLRVESVSNRFLERPHRLTRAETAALVAAGLHQPDDDSPNWHVDLHAAPPAVGAGLLVRLLGIHDPGLRRGFRIQTVGDEPGRPHAAEAGEADRDDAPAPEPGTTVEGIAGPMLVVLAEEPEVEAVAAALARLVAPWLAAVPWPALSVVVDQAGCPFAAEVAPSEGRPLARLLPYVAAPPEIEATLHDLGWTLAEGPERWWVRPFPPHADAEPLLAVVVETLHAVCGLRLDQPVLVQVAPS